VRNDDDLLCFIMCLHVMTSAVDIYIYIYEIVDDC